MAPGCPAGDPPSVEDASLAGPLWEPAHVVCRKYVLQKWHYCGGKKSRAFTPKPKCTTLPKKKKIACSDEFFFPVVLFFLFLKNCTIYHKKKLISRICRKKKLQDFTGLLYMSCIFCCFACLAHALCALCPLACSGCPVHAPVLISDCVPLRRGRQVCAVSPPMPQVWDVCRTREHPSAAVFSLLQGLPPPAYEQCVIQSGLSSGFADHLLASWRDGRCPAAMEHLLRLWTSNRAAPAGRDEQIQALVAEMEPDDVVRTKMGADKLLAVLHAHQAEHGDGAVVGLARRIVQGCVRVCECVCVCVCE